MKTITFHLDDDRHERLREIAYAKRVHKTDLLRAAIDIVIAQYNGKKEVKP